MPWRRAPERSGSAQGGALDVTPEILVAEAEQGSRDRSRACRRDPPRATGSRLYRLRSRRGRRPVDRGRGRSHLVPAPRRDRQPHRECRIGDFAEARRCRPGRCRRSDSRGSERAASALLEFDQGVGAYAQGSTRSCIRRRPAALLSAPSRALLAPAEMLVTKRKRGFRCAAGSGGMQQPDRPSAGGVRVPRFRETSCLAGGRPTRPPAI